ncbi:hypothetical protein [Endozoicomonas sp. ALD040]|uniref:hypothetical protein n=1 Tax=Endozoicomonas sp. ALD040 TaxID=3403079 RepID=UPI003BAEA4C1
MTGVNSFPHSVGVAKLHRKTPTWVSQNSNINSFPCSEVVIPAKAGIQRQRWISDFSGMARPGGLRAVWFWWWVSVDSRLRGNDGNDGNDGNEAGNDGSQLVPSLRGCRKTLKLNAGWCHSVTADNE